MQFISVDTLFWSSGLYGGLLANLAAIVDLELKKREAGTASIILLSRALITSKLKS